MEMNLTGHNFVRVMAKIEGLRLADFIELYGGDEEHGLGQHLFNKLYPANRDGFRIGIKWAALYYFDSHNIRTLIGHCKGKIAEDKLAM